MHKRLIGWAVGPLRLNRLVLLVLAVLAAPGAAIAQRLPLVAAPLHYDLRVSPDLASERFAGEVRIRVRVLAATATFVLHAADLEIQSAAVRADGREQPARAMLDPSAQTVTLIVPAMVQPGE